MGKSPFPGMDPYLESPELWPEVHSRLIVAIADSVSEQLSDKYRVAIEKRTYLNEPDESLMVGIPDVSVLSQQAKSESKNVSATAVLPKTVTLPMAEEVQERYLEIREVSNGAVVTAIEVLSPKNKRAGEGRQAYEKKRYRVLASLTNLVEIDLLRSGRSLPRSAIDRQGCYSILVSRSELRPQAQLYDFDLRQVIPTFTLPLKAEDDSIPVDLQQLMAGIYHRAKYHLAIDYNKSLKPALSRSDAEWVRTFVLKNESETT